MRKSTEQSDGVFRMGLFAIFAAVTLFVGMGNCVKVFTTYDRVDAVVVKKELLSGGRGTCYLVTLSYTYKGEDYRHVVDINTPDLYRVGGHAVLYIGDYNGGDEQVLSDVLIFPIAALVLLVVSTGYVRGYFRDE